MSSLIDLAAATTQSWTSLYTWRLPDDLRDNRRAEIASDLWEHRQLASLLDEAAWQTALEMMLRFLTGVPSDCAWRLETGAIVRAEKRSLSMHSNSRLIRGLTVTAIVVAALVPFVGISIMINGWRNDIDLVWMTWGFIPLLASLPIFAGLYLSPSRPTLGISLVVAGCLVVSATWFWLFMLTIPASIGLIAISYYRGKQAGWRADTRSDPAV